jgi:hypothetical protein
MRRKTEHSGPVRHRELREHERLERLRLFLDDVDQAEIAQVSFPSSVSNAMRNCRITRMRQK